MRAEVRGRGGASWGGKGGLRYNGGGGRYQGGDWGGKGGLELEGKCWKRTSAGNWFGNVGRGEKGRW